MLKIRLARYINLIPSLFYNYLVSRAGFEPATNSLKGYCSTIELTAQKKETKVILP